MIVVADSGPLHYLILLEQIELLRRFYGQVLVPEAVAGELSGMVSSSVPLRLLPIRRSAPAHRAVTVDDLANGAQRQCSQEDSGLGQRGPWREDNVTEWIASKIQGARNAADHGIPIYNLSVVDEAYRLVNAPCLLSDAAKGDPPPANLAAICRAK